MGLDVNLYRGKHGRGADGECKGEPIEQPSAKYPEHLFRIGYFRSSYNAGGINGVLQQYAIPNLYDIFEATDDYVLAPDWPACEARCAVALAAFTAARERMRFRVYRESVHAAAAPTSEALALDLYLGELRKQAVRAERGWPSSYSSRGGSFYHDGLTIRAVIPARSGLVGVEACYLVVEQPEDAMRFYREALEIVAETIAWVQSQPKPQAFHLHWSA